MPTYDLFELWGHTLETIEVNSTFRIFLQNLNGLSVYHNNHLLRQDLQTCYDYGAGVICFPETNTNWSQAGQLATMHQLFRGVWKSSVLQTSHTPDPFLSNYQPGGTLTAICKNCVSRVVAKGEDPFGLGRWSYVTLRGVGSTKITVVTAYNACQSAGDTTYYHQQLRVLSSLHRDQHINAPPDPRCQFILDLQSWSEHLHSEGHQFILAMDANETYNPDVVAPKHPLLYNASSLTVNGQHNGKLSTLVSSCDLCLPLAHHHETRPFPASHIRGRNQIDYIFVSKPLLPAVQHSGVLAHHSLTRGDHRPYYLDFEPAMLFSDPAYNIEPASIRKL